MKLRGSFWSYIAESIFYPLLNINIYLAFLVFVIAFIVHSWDITDFFLFCHNQ